jgi:hypothetical protein
MGGYVSPYPEAFGMLRQAVKLYRSGRISAEEFDALVGEIDARVDACHKAAREGGSFLPVIDL